MNVLLVLGHPRPDSFCGALAKAYEDGAREATVDVRTLIVADLTFEPNVETECPTDQYVEPDIRTARQHITWADHLVFVYPNWWGTMPALLKGFFDRVFAPEFAFSFYEDGEGAGHEELLSGRTAELIVTMDMPGWVYRWIYRQPGTNAVKRSTLGFAGIRTTRVTTLGPVTDSTPEQRETWLEEVIDLGRSLTDGAESRTSRLVRRLETMVSALRLQFYPMSWVAYTIGALAVAGSDVLTSSVYWAGFGFLFFLEAATVLSNEYFDYETDRRNTFAGPFTGGSRVLVDGKASFETVKAGIGVTLALTVAFGVTVLTAGIGDPISALAVMGVLAVLALGYTIPPLSLSYRTLGELDVAVTHSVGVLVCGFVFLGGSVTDPLPWLLGTPLLLATIPSITLAGIPDVAADRAAGKRTIAVRVGPRRAAVVAGAIALLAALVAVAWLVVGIVPEAYGPAIFLSVPHALVLGWMLWNRLDGLTGPRRIDRLMIASLSYVLWFGVVPLIGLL